MLFQLLCKAGLVSSVALVLSACGGGGGGGDDESSASRSSLTLDDKGYSTRKAALNTHDDFERTSKEYGSTEAVFTLVAEVVDSILSNDLKTFSSDGDTARALNNTTDLACENEGGSVRLTNKSVGEMTEIHHQFNNCRLRTANLGQLLLDGTYLFRSQPTSSSATESWSGSETFAMTGKYLDSDTPFVLKGGASWTEFVDAEAMKASFTLRSDTIEFRKGSNYVAFEDYRSTINVDENLYSTSVQFKMTSSGLKGYVEYTTPKPVVLDLALDGCPLQGVNRIEGDGVVEIRHGRDTGTSFEVVVEVNNNAVASYEICDDFNYELQKDLPENTGST